MRRHIDRVAAKFPPLKYALQIQDRYEALHGNVSANSITLTAFLALFALTLLAVALVGYLDRSDVDIAAEITKWLGLSGDAADLVTNAVRTASNSARFATVIGFEEGTDGFQTVAGHFRTLLQLRHEGFDFGRLERPRPVVVPQPEQQVDGQRSGPDHPGCHGVHVPIIYVLSVHPLDEAGYPPVETDSRGRPTRDDANVSGETMHARVGGIKAWRWTAVRC